MTTAVKLTTSFRLPMKYKRLALIAGSVAFGIILLVSVLTWTPAVPIPKPLQEHPCLDRPTSSTQNPIPLPLANCITRLSATYDPATTDFISSTDPDKFHIITNFFVASNPSLGKQFGFPEEHTDLKSWDAMLHARDIELVTVLQRNLNHPEVAAVHILYDHPCTSYYLSQLKLENCSKLILHSIRGSLKYKDSYAYAFNQLAGKLVVCTNQDIFLGSGWDVVNGSFMRGKKVMYALTRHSLSTCTQMSMCQPGGVYHGSHDTFVFYAKKGTNLTALDPLIITSDMDGIENVLIWLFQNRLKYRVLNPCRVLLTYHLHCVGISRKGRQRINYKLGMSGTVPFSSLLE